MSLYKVVAWCKIYKINITKRLMEVLLEIATLRILHALNDLHALYQKFESRFPVYIAFVFYCRFLFFISRWGDTLAELIGDLSLTTKVEPVAVHVTPLNIPFSVELK